MSRDPWLRGPGFEGTGSPHIIGREPPPKRVVRMAQRPERRALPGARRARKEMEEEERQRRVLLYRAQMEAEKTITFIGSDDK